MYWIECRPNEDIPYGLIYDGCQKDKDRNDHTPLMLWIENRPGEAIPQHLLLYEGYETDKDNYGRTPLMLWI